MFSLSAARAAVAVLRPVPALIIGALLYVFYNSFFVLCGSDPDAKSTLPRKLKAGSCPYASNGAPLPEGHSYIAPKKDDSRSPCPALNTLANHGYLPRNGRKITGHILGKALIDGFNLSWPIATGLAWGGVVALGQVGTFSLHDLARHNRIEHDASITHLNTRETDEYAPIRSDPALMAAFLRDARPGSKVFGVREIARARIRREAERGTKVDAVQQLVARGEVALFLQIFGNENYEVEYEVLKSWWWEQRLPENWKPARQSTIRRTYLLAKALTDTMEQLRLDEKVLRWAKRAAEADSKAVMQGSAELHSTSPITSLDTDSDSDSDGEIEAVTPPTPFVELPPFSSVKPLIN